MKVKLCVSIILITILSYAPQCHAQGNTSISASPISTEFAWNLFRHSRNSSRDVENFILSPLIVQQLISILQYAAEGSTKEQIIQITGRVNPLQLYYILNPAVKSPEVKSASGIFIDLNDRVNEYVSLNIYINGGDIYRVPLQNDPAKATNIINTWVSNATGGHISQFFKDENDISKVRALLASAVYFHSTWQDQFKPSQSRKFSTMFNNEVLTDFMEVEGYIKMANFNVAKNNRATVINLPYKENRYSMFLIIPDPGTNLNTFTEMLTYKKFSEIIQNPSQLSSTKLKLFMPKFKISSKVSLVSTLQKMGLVDIFVPSRSQLTKLIDGHESLIINEILQQSTLEVDEIGTTATSVVTVSVVPLSAAEETEVFVIDRPFLAVIVENANQAPLFLSKITNPAK